MGARKGADVLARFREAPPEVWHRGKKVENVVDEPGFANGIRSLASLYDYQWKHADRMLSVDSDTGSTVSRTYSIPRTADELRQLGDAMHCAAEHSKGMMGREPSY
ncbi:MAG: hypothetical protein JHD35_27000, partial [Sphingopyxis sp.]|nr:hypothetical protein [Sphingopyxis sp.]